MNKINQSVLKNLSVFEPDWMYITLKTWHGEARFFAKTIKSL